MTDEDWRHLKNDINVIFTTDNYFWDLKEAEILAERVKMLAYVEPYVGKYFSTEYIKRNILRYTPEELKGLEKEMAIDRQRIAQEQAAMAAQQAAQGMSAEEAGQQ
jgi:hypothetical protein